MVLRSKLLQNGSVALITFTEDNQQVYRVVEYSIGGPLKNKFHYDGHDLQVAKKEYQEVK